MAQYVSGGVYIKKNNVIIALCRSAMNAAYVLAANPPELKILPDDDITLVRWTSDSNGKTVEIIEWVGCGWSTVDYYRTWGIR